eukprot:622785-Ditylum_brightwellii.AAC.1
MCAKLEHAGITTVKELKDIDNNKSAMGSIIVKSQDGNGKGGLNLNMLRSLHLCAQNSEEGTPPPDVDH